ncbi:MAG: alpha/beta hydrolase, partial [Gammaproteobacteria bacterium]|nr:alpha/beta hydrolase [Gammaproteobacteria bacterium]
MDGYFDLNQQTYDWCARAFEQVRKVLGVRIKMHHAPHQIDDASIFLFNHFARVETFIPQYLIYQEIGAYCRSIAAAQFFAGNDRFASVLRDLGVVPNKHPHLMELLAIDILRGRKIVVFPEGGMVK